MKEMVSTRILAWTGAAIALLCLVAGFASKGFWMIWFLFPALVIYWFLMRKGSSRITIAILLFADILFSAIGLVVGVSPYPMLIGCSSALAAWESAEFRLNFSVTPTDRVDPRLEKLHNKDLALAVGAGLFLGILGLNIRFNLPFGIVVVLVLVAVIGMYRGYKLLSHVQ